MKSSRLLWITVGSAALLSTLLLLSGFIYAILDILYPKPSDLGAPPQLSVSKEDSLQVKKEIRIIALGDSLSKGTGDETGEGYVNRVKMKLIAQLKKPVFVENYAVNGWRADNLLNYLNQPNVPNLLVQADVILLTIGGNDLNQAAANPINSTPSNVKQEFSEINYDSVRQSLAIAEEKLKLILTKIAEINPKAKIIYISLYQPYLNADPKREGAAIVQDWNRKAESVVNLFPNMAVIPTFDLFQFQLEKYLFVDDFHPNGAGYERIADRVVQALQ